MEVSDFEMRNQIKEMQLVAVRILKCFLSVFLIKGSYNSADAARFWLMRVMRRVTTSNPKSLFLQIPYMNEKMAADALSFLSGKSANKLEAFLSLDKYQLRTIFQSSVTNANVGRLNSVLRCLPALDLELVCSLKEGQFKYNTGEKWTLYIRKSRSSPRKLCEHAWHQFFTLVVSNQECSKSFAKNSILFFRRFRIHDQESISANFPAEQHGSEKWALKFDLPPNYDRNCCKIEIFHDFWAGLEYSVDSVPAKSGTL